MAHRPFMPNRHTAIIHHVVRYVLCSHGTAQNRMPLALQDEMFALLSLKSPSYVSHHPSPFTALTIPFHIILGKNLSELIGKILA